MLATLINFFYSTLKCLYLGKTTNMKEQWERKLNCNIADNEWNDAWRIENHLQMWSNFPTNYLPLLSDFCLLI